MTYTELYEALKPYGCVAIYLTGATCIGLNSDHDEDLIVFCTKKDQIPVLVQQVKQYREYWDIHVQHVKSIRLRWHEIPLWVTLFLYMKHKAGEEIISPYTLEKHINTFKTRAQKYDWNNPNIRPKYWYYLLLGLYTINNNDISLTSEQLQNIQDAHDGNMSQELKNWCLNQLQ